MIDLREFDQQQHGTRDEALKRDLLEPSVDQELAQRIRDAIEQREADACLERYHRGRAGRA